MMPEESRVLDDNKLSSTDYISALPDHLLHEIFCYFEFDDILRTSCLSKRWRYLWALQPHLYFDVDDMHSFSERNAITEQADDGDADDDGEGDDDNDGEGDNDNDGDGDDGDENDEDDDNDGNAEGDSSYYDMATQRRRRRRLVNLVNLVLSIRKGPIGGFSLTFNPVYDEDHSSCVSKWINILQSRRVKYLDLDFSENGWVSSQYTPQYELPSQVFDHFEGLASLGLRSCRLQLGSTNSECIALKSLTVLNLDHVSVSDKDMNERILPNAPLLKTSILWHCHDLTRLDIPPDLKSLQVSECYRIDEIKAADSPNLEKFDYMAI